MCSVAHARPRSVVISTIRPSVILTTPAMTPEGRTSLPEIAKSHRVRSVLKCWPDHPVQVLVLHTACSLPEEPATGAT